jgi:hypothetical protein
MFGICGTSKANIVIPAKAAIQRFQKNLDPRLCGGDEKKVLPKSEYALAATRPSPAGALT